MGRTVDGLLPHGVPQAQTEGGGIVLAVICWSPSAQMSVCCHVCVLSCVPFLWYPMSVCGAICLAVCICMCACAHKCARPRACERGAVCVRPRSHADAPHSVVLTDGGEPPQSLHLLLIGCSRRWRRPRSPCIGSSLGCARRWRRPRSPCTCSCVGCARRWRRPRSPCTCSCVGCGRKWRRAPAVLAFASLSVVLADGGALAVLALGPLSVLLNSRAFFSFFPCNHIINK